MSETINKGWLKDTSEIKFAPKTLIEQVQDNDGKLLSVYLDELATKYAAILHEHSANDITSGVLSVSNGGTGNSELTQGEVLVGNGTDAVYTLPITNFTTKQYINYNGNLMTTNTLAHWNGAFDASGTSNLSYCAMGAFGSIITKNSDDYLPVTGGTVLGTLTINNSNSSGYLELSEDSEGGTIRLCSKSGTYIYEIDAFSDESIRVHTHTKNPNGSGVTLSWNGKSGSLSVPGTITEGGTALSSKYLALSGGTMTGTINSSKNTGTYWNGNSGHAIINSTTSAGSYTMLAKLNSTNGYFTHGVYGGNYLLNYTAKSTVDAASNTFTKQTILMNESGDATFANKVTAANEFVSTYPNGLRIAYGSYGFFIRNDGSNTYFMLTNSGEAATGTWNSLRPFTITNSNGAVNIDNGLYVKSGLSIRKTSSVLPIIYMGASGDTSTERQIRYQVTSGTYPHNVTLYGGNSDSTTAIGVYDSKNSRSVWAYTDTTNTVTFGSTVTLASNKYTDSGPSVGALNANNSNIYGVNSIIFADECGDAAEGIQFYRTATTVDTLWAKAGVLYFTPNRTYGSQTTNYTVLTSGNYSSWCAAKSHSHSYLPLSGGSMTGAIKSLRGTYTSTASNRYGNSALEIRENGAVGTAQTDIGYAPSIGFHWSGRCAGTLILDSSARFQFLNQSGGNAPVWGSFFGANQFECVHSGSNEAKYIAHNGGISGTFCASASYKIGIYNNTTASWVIYSDSSGAVTIPKQLTITGVLNPQNGCEIGGNLGVSGDIYANGANGSPLGSSYAINARIGDDGRLRKVNSSSIRYKNHISDLTYEDIEPLYTIPTHWFKYKPEYIEQEDIRFDTPIPGYYVEDWMDVMPIAIDLNKDGLPEMWNQNIVIPLTFEMVKGNHNRINDHSKEIDTLKAENNDLKARIEKLEKIIEGLCA